jgi:hypothetical protein
VHRRHIVRSSARRTTEYPDRRRSGYDGRAEQVWLTPVGGTTEHDFFKEFAMLMEYVGSAAV